MPGRDDGFDDSQLSGGHDDHRSYVPPKPKDPPPTYKKKEKKDDKGDKGDKDKK